MKELFKNRTVVISLAIIILVLLAGGGYLYMNRHKTGNVAQTISPDQSSDVEMLPTDAISVTLTPTTANQYSLKIDKIPSGVQKMTYQITYATADNAERGFGGSDIEIKPGEYSYTNDKIIFGTCSSGKCVYDKGVNNIKIDVRFTFADNSEKGWTGSLSI